MSVNISKKSFFLISLVLSVSILAILSNEALAKTSEEKIKEHALKKVAEINKVDVTTLKIENSAISKINKKEIHNFKIVDDRGNSYGIVLNDDSVEVDPDDELKAEIDGYVKQNGKVAKELAEKIKTADSNEVIRVIVWLKESDKNSAPEKPDFIVNEGDYEKKTAAVPSDIKPDDWTSSMDKKHTEKVKKVTDPFIKKMKKKGYQLESDSGAPVVFARLKPDEIREFAGNPEVSVVAEDQQNERALNVARSTIKANIVYDRSITGTDVKVGEIEVGGEINPLNTYLNGVLRDTLNTCVHDHAAAVAGILRSWHTTYYGIAPEMNLRIGGSCGGWSSELTQAATRAADWGAFVITNSWGSASGGLNLNSNDYFFDYMVYNRYRTVIVAAGNRGTGDRDVTSPALAYNVVSVGNFDDRSSTSWLDDNMHASSSYDDPISLHGDREKPEVAAPGANIGTTKNAYPYYSSNMGSGTSYSAPMVAGEVAQIINRRSDLYNDPSAIKAIVMVSARHNIEGATRLSDKDGAGGIVNQYADDVARGYKGGTGEISYTCSKSDDYDLASMYLYAGRKTRVAIAWSTDPDAPYYYNYATGLSRPSADLDLRIMRGTTQVASSSSWDNTYEIVEFTPAVTGYHTIRVRKHSCNSVKYIGWAWIRE